MSTAAATPEAEAGKGGRSEILVVFTGLMLVMLMASLDQTIVSTALPTIVRDLGGLTHISWVVTAYMLAQTAVTPIYGKLGDLYGRKVVLQAGLVLFLAGSVLCGISQNLTELVLFRALQGLGGGGLMVSTMAAIGDVVPPRDRGRYQGFFGAVFGLSSVIGPLLGGFFTTSLSWRWIFYVNLPIGVVAFLVLAATLPSRREQSQRRVDYLGAALLAAALAGIVLTCTFGGVDYSWTSPTIIGMGVASLALVAAFVVLERRAAEPVMPPRLFANRVFSVTSAIGLIVGFALFGSVTYLPLFLQTVMGASPTGSGLQILPLMGGLLITSIGSGQIISKTGRYKPFPIAGTAVMIVGLYLLSTMDASTSRLAASAFMFVLGLGLGMVMQVLVLAVQNAVDYQDLGVATSGATLFRSIGGSVGTAILGSIFSSRLKANEARGQAHIPAFTNALDHVFIIAAGVAAFAFLLSWLLEQRPLRDSVAASSTGVGEAFAVPKPGDSLAEMARALSLVVGQEGRRALVEQIAARAGVELSAAGAWLLARLAHDPSADVLALCEAYDVPAERAKLALAELRARGMIKEEVAVAGGPRATHTRYLVTELGAETAAKLVAERRATFARLLDGWEPERYAEVARLLTNVANEAGLHPARELSAR